MNYLIIQALEKYHGYYGDALQVQLPANSGNIANLQTVANDLRKRLTNLFIMNPQGKRLLNGKEDLFNNNEHFKELILFYECFHGDNGRGVGASHQTGWTGIIGEIIGKLAE